MQKYPNVRLKDKQNKNHHQKSVSKTMANHGYGYMKRRYGLLSNEIDSIQEESDLTKDPS